MKSKKPCLFWSCLSSSSHFIFSSKTSLAVIFCAPEPKKMRLEVTEEKKRRSRWCDSLLNLRNIQRSSLIIVNFVRVFSSNSEDPLEDTLVSNFMHSLKTEIFFRNKMGSTFFTWDDVSSSEDFAIRSVPSSSHGMPLPDDVKCEKRPFRLPFLSCHECRVRKIHLECYRNANEFLVSPLLTQGWCRGKIGEMFTFHLCNLRNFGKQLEKFNKQSM